MGEPSTAMVFLRMIASLAAVVALIFVLSWVVKRYIKPEQWMAKTRSGTLRVLETLALDHKRKVIVLEWESKKILVGMTESSIQLLSTEVASAGKSAENSTLGGQS